MLQIIVELGQQPGGGVLLKPEELTESKEEEKGKDILFQSEMC